MQQYSSLKIIYEDLTLSVIFTKHYSKKEQYSDLCVVFKIKE
jgi:hypothetical protein